MHPHNVIIMGFGQYYDQTLPHVNAILQTNAIKLIIVVTIFTLHYVAYTDFNLNKQACKHLDFIITTLTKFRIPANIKSS